MTPVLAALTRMVRVAVHRPLSPARSGRTPTTAGRLCAALAALGLAGAGGPQTAAAALPEPVGSYLVSVAAPSVHDVYSSLLSKTSSTVNGDVADLAAKFAPELAAADAAAQRGQAPVVAAAERMGAKVVSRYTAAANGLLLHATASQVSALAVRPDVVRVEPAPRVRPALGRSVAHLRGPDVWTDPGYRGEGIVIAIADTGIDYTHADFGGPGTTAAYQAAVTRDTTIDDLWEGVPLFPTEKVVGGWDFVGGRYNPPWLCSPQQETAGACTTTPEPDPDPLDGWGHGTHVAGIAAGSGTPSGTVAPGVAPEAQLVALKVYSHQASVDEEVDVAVDVIEWCTRVNLGLAVPGTVPPAGYINVLNMSFGEPYGQGSILFDEATAAASDVGITVVASAGNDGNVPWIAGSPAASRGVLSVASSTPPGDANGLVFTWADQNGAQRAEYLGSEGDATRALQEVGRVEAEMAWIGNGCTGAPVYQEVRGKVALVDRVDCAIAEKVGNAQAAGSVGILVYTDTRPRRGLSENPDGAQIPGMMIDNAAGIAVRALLEAGHAVTVVLDPADVRADLQGADAIVGSSSRGPGKHGTLKPDITAPGQGIVSAGMGNGDGGRRLGGTSMSAPHAAGAAALIRERAVAHDLNLSGADVAALLMNSALPVITDSGAGGSVREVVRQGAGRIDLVRAAAAPVVVRAGDIASIMVGPVAVSGTAPAGDSAPYSLEVSVKNLSDALVSLAPVPHFRTAAAGLALQFETVPARVDVEPLETATFYVHLRIDPVTLPSWPYGGTGGFGAAAASGVELDGWLELQQVSASGEPLDGTVNPHLPFYVLARPASSVSSAGMPPPAWTPEPPDALHVEFANASAFEGVAELFWHLGEDADEPDVLHELDIRHVGVRFTSVPPAVTGTVLSTAVSLWEPMTVPYGTRLEVYVDTDADGRPDHRIRTEPAQGMSTSFVALAARWDPDNEQASGEQVVGPLAWDVHSRVLRIDVPLVSLGMSGPGPVGVSIRHRVAERRSANDFEDWLGSTQEDVAPDDAHAGGMFTFAPASAPWSLTEWGTVVAPRDTARLELVPTGETGPAEMLAVFPGNDPGPANAQARVLPADVIPGQEESAWLYLPVTMMKHELYPLDADKAVREAIAALDSATRFRMTYDHLVTADPGVSALREYAFDGDTAVNVVTRPKVGQDIEEVRFGGSAYARFVGENWRCGAVGWYLWFRPELIRVLEQFPTTGWLPDGHAANDPSLLQFRTTRIAEGEHTFLAQVPEAGGPIVLLSRTLGDLATPVNRDVFRVRAVNDPTLAVRPPDGVRCD